MFGESSSPKLFCTQNNLGQPELTIVRSIPANLKNSIKIHAVIFCTQNNLGQPELTIVRSIPANLNNASETYDW